MARDSYRLKGTSKVYIIPIGDIHVGSEQFHQEYFEHALDTIDSIKAEKRIYLMGDLLEAASKQVGNASFKTDRSLDQQIDYIIKTLKPYKKDIIYSCIGNHCARLSKDYDLDVMKIIGKSLDIPTGNSTIDSFKINQEEVNVYVAHGKGSAAHAHTAQGKMLRETQAIEADIYLQGHCHRLDFFSQPIRTHTGIKRKYYAFTGAFLKYNGYPAAMQLPILPEAFQLLSVNKDHIVRSTPYYIDQVRPDLFRM